MKIVNYSEFFEVRRVFNHFLLNLFQFVIFIVVNSDWHLVCIVIQVNKAIVKEETTVAFLSITIIHLFTSLNIIQSFNDKSPSVIGVVPGCLPWSFMVEHIGICYKTIRFNSFHLNTKNTTRNHHSDFRILLNWELSEFGNFFANKIII